MGGQDWVGPHREVGRLLLGHTARRVLVGRRRQVIIRTASKDASAGYWARLPPKVSCGLNYPSLLDQGQGVAHACAIVQRTPDGAGISSSTRRSHDRSRAYNTSHIVASQHTQPVMGGCPLESGCCVRERRPPLSGAFPLTRLNRVNCQPWLGRGLDTVVNQ